MAWLRGAIIKKVARFNEGGSKAQLMERYDGMVEHVAVSNGLSLFTQFNTPGEPCSHFYVRKSGPQGENAGMADFEQYVDTRYRAPAQLDGNHRMISCETQGGVGADLDNGWTVAAVNRLAWIAWQCHLAHDFPLTAMHNSLPSSRGVGYHRLGINPWRVSGGEVWSSSNGKVCPGSARMAQIPTIISKAIALSAPPAVWEDDEMLSPEAITQVRAAVQAENEEYGSRLWGQPTGTGTRFIANTTGDLDAISSKLDDLAAATATNQAALVDALTTVTAALNALTAALPKG